jgi:cell division protein FtsB
MNLALILPILQMLPGLVDGGLRVFQALRDDPETPAEVRAELDELHARLTALAVRVKDSQFSG